MSEKLRIACLGTTHPHASARIRALRALDEVEVISAADEDPGLSAFCEKYDLAPTTERAILEDRDVTAVVVHSKSDRMVALARAALEAGKRVLVEKPGGANVEDISELVAAVEREGGIVQVGYNCRLAESVQRARRLLAEGVIGDVVTVNAHGAAKVREHLSAHLNQPADIGGGLWVIGCHVIDVVLALCGVPKSVNARVAKFSRVSDSRSREDAAGAIFSYEQLLATYDFSVHDDLEWFETSRVTLSGTEGLLEVGLIPQTLTVHLNEPRAGLPAGWTRWHDTQFAIPWAVEQENDFSELPEISNLDFFHTEARDFAAAVREGAAPTVTVEDALNVARVIQACFDSEQAAGGEVSLDIGATR